MKESMLKAAGFGLWLLTLAVSLVFELLGLAFRNIEITIMTVLVMLWLWVLTHTALGDRLSELSAKPLTQASMGEVFALGVILILIHAFYTRR